MESASPLPSVAFHRVFIDRSLPEHKVIQFDVDKAQELGLASQSGELTHSLHRHFLDSLEAIQVSGSEDKFDFQHYHWGICLSLDPHLSEMDKVKTLFAFYSQHVFNRLVRKEFEQIIKKHSNFRYLDAFHRRIKWDDLIASFQLHVKKETHRLPTIGVKNMLIILESNRVQVDIDVPRLVSFIRRQDKTRRALLGLLKDDPLLQGQSESLSLYT